MADFRDKFLTKRKDKARGRKVACVLCKLLDLIDPNHCEKAIERDRGKRPGQYDPPKP